MCHRGEIVLAGARFLANSYNNLNVLRLEGVSIPALLSGILSPFELDNKMTFPLVMKQMMKAIL